MSSSAIAACFLASKLAVLLSLLLFSFLSILGNCFAPLLGGGAFFGEAGGGRAFFGEVGVLARAFLGDPGVFLGDPGIFLGDVCVGEGALWTMRRVKGGESEDGLRMGNPPTPGPPPGVGTPPVVWLDPAAELPCQRKEKKSNNCYDYICL